MLEAVESEAASREAIVEEDKQRAMEEFKQFEEFNT